MSPCAADRELCLDSNSTTTNACQRISLQAAHATADCYQRKRGGTHRRCENIICCAKGVMTARSWKIGCWRIALSLRCRRACDLYIVSCSLFAPSFVAWSNCRSSFRVSLSSTSGVFSLLFSMCRSSDMLVLLLQSALSMS